MNCHSFNLFRINLFRVNSDYQQPTSANDKTSKCSSKTITKSESTTNYSAAIFSVGVRSQKKK